MPLLPKNRPVTDYDKWFDEQVGLSLKEADDPETVWISDEDVRKEWEIRRASMMQREDAPDKPA